MTGFGLGLLVASSPVLGPSAPLAAAAVGDTTTARIATGLWVAGASVAFPAAAPAIAAGAAVQNELIDVVARPAEEIRKAMRRGLFP